MLAVDEETDTLFITVYGATIEVPWNGGVPDFSKLPMCDEPIARQVWSNHLALKEPIARLDRHLV